MCSQPLLTLQQSYTQSSPQLVYRSAVVSLSTITSTACNSSYTLTNAWQASRIDAPQTVELTTNPTCLSSGLVIQPYTLAYGLYEFTFQVSLTLSDGRILTSMASTFVQIVPTGLAVYALQNGVANILVGSQQPLTLDPASYSVDLDYLIATSSLQYTFYCHTLDVKSNNLLAYSLPDLLTYKLNSALAMASNQSCFDSNCIIHSCIK